MDFLSESTAAELILFLAKLSRETDREFVVGIWQAEKHISEHLLFVEASTPISKSTDLRLMLNGR